MGEQLRIIGVLVGAILLMGACGGAGDTAQSTTSRPDANTETRPGNDGSTTPLEAGVDSENTTNNDGNAADQPGSGLDAEADSTENIAPNTEVEAGTDEPTSVDGDSPPNPAVAKLVPVGPGDSGEDVLALQEHLAEIGFGPGSPDGSYGNKTENAVASFQELSGLTATGEVDRRTLDVLADYRYDGLVLRAGDEGAEVKGLQQRLAAGPFDPGPIDGEYGGATVQAVWALEKLAGVPVDGDWGPLDEQAWADLQDGKIGRPEKTNDQRWVEVDLSQQLAKVYEAGEQTPMLIVHISSGSGVPWANEDHSGSSITPLGDFHIDRRINGWRESSLNIGRLYNPLYFNGGIAFHGANSVPLHPASHGCVRVPLHIAEYLPDQLPNGTPVHILA